MSAKSKDRTSHEKEGRCHERAVHSNDQPEGRINP
jgi:hypothetical protein